MILPSPTTHTPLPLPPFGVARNSPERAAYLRRLTKIQIHNLARHIAALPAAGIRRAWLAELGVKQSPHLVNRVRRCVRWYFRARAA